MWITISALALWTIAFAMSLSLALSEKEDAGARAGWVSACIAQATLIIVLSARLAEQLAA